MAIRTKAEDGDVLAGVIGIRGPDGSIIETIKFYREAPDGAKVKPGKLTEAEKDVCDGIVHDMANMFHQCMESIRESERKRTGL